MKVLIPGTYDPVTLGHIDIIKRSAAVFEEVCAVVMDNPEKKGKHMFCTEERVRMLRESAAEIPNVSVDVWHGMLVDYVKENGIDIIVKGIRGSRDLAYEKNMARVNAELYPGAVTLFMPASEKYEKISSTELRRRIKNAEPIDDIAPECVIKKVYGK